MPSTCKGKAACADLLVDSVKLRLHFCPRRAFVKSLATRAGDNKLAIRVSAQEDITAGAGSVAFLGRAEHSPAAAAYGAADQPARKRADTRNDGTNKCPGNGATTCANRAARPNCAALRPDQRTGEHASTKARASAAQQATKGCAHAHWAKGRRRQHRPHHAGRKRRGCHSARAGCE